MYFDEKTHEEVIYEMIDNIKDGYNQSLQTLNYACFLHEKNKNENDDNKHNITIQLYSIITSAHFLFFN